MDQSVIQQALAILTEAGQQHILEEFPKRKPEEQMRLAKQTLELNNGYPGGIKEYIKRAQILLKDAKEGANPYDDYTPSVPSGEVLSFDDPGYEELEMQGLAEVPYTGFVLVAGGLGERLGYSSIKIGLPVTCLLPTMTFISYYIQCILALAEKVRPTLPEDLRSKFCIPLCIMTSDDTDKATKELLAANNNYGLPAEHLVIVKQEKVPALTGIDGAFALAENFEIVTKPHGHGDVHTLLHMHGVVKDLKERLGKRWILFFQDTNPLTFKSLLPLLAISAKHQYDMNSVTVPRKPGEAVGAICKMTHDKTKQALTINVEYNQLDSVLKAKFNKAGDVPGPDGFSVFPGNINVLLFKVASYYEALEKTHGCVPEFVNPKYADASKTRFKTPTRLECMMQDIPRLFDPTAKIGFTRCERWLCFSPVKNNLVDAAAKSQQGLGPECASSCEADLFYANMRFLQKAGAQIEPLSPADSEVFGGVKVPLYPKLVLLPSFYVTIKDLKAQVSSDWRISKQSTLIIDEKAKTLRTLHLDGAVNISAPVTHVEVPDKKYLTFVPLVGGEEEYLKIRGYKCSRTSLVIIA